MESQRNARPPAAAPTNAGAIPLAVRRGIGAMLLGGTMGIAGLLALWRSVAALF